MKRAAIITGCSGGIGQALVHRFSAAGWHVTGVDRRDPPDSLPLDDFQTVEMTDFADLQRLIECCRRQDRLDTLVNNAAVAIDKPFQEVTLDDWRQTMDVNVRAAFFLTQGLTDHLRRTRGSVVNISSVHAVATAPRVASYATSKGALVALSRALAIELAHCHVRVNSLLPGAVDTDMLHAGISRNGPGDSATARAALADRTPLGEIGTPAQIAEAAFFLADSDLSGFITGQALIVDGGATAQLSTET